MTDTQTRYEEPKKTQPLPEAPPAVEPEPAQADTQPIQAYTRLGDVAPPAVVEAAPRRSRVGPVFWTFACIFSLLVNVILIAALLVVGSQLFSLKEIVQQQIVGGLYGNFVLMDQAHIRTQIPVKTSVPAKFDLPLKTDTAVTLTADTIVRGARVSIITGVVNINSAPTDIILPAGTLLPVRLDLSVPVDQQIPVELMVDVDIPLRETDLHTPFVGLQNVVAPYYTTLEQLPDSWQDVLCGSRPDQFCRWLFR